jgi:AcrR family transcriptional regulator
MDVRGSLLEAAITVYSETGMRGATTRRIAETAGVNEVTLFRHFKSKGELMQAALLRVTSSVIARSLPDRPADPKTELLEWCRAHHRELYKRRALIRKAMSEFEQDPGCCARGMQASVRVATELAEYLRKLKRSGLASGDWDERAATNMLMGAIFADAMGRDTMPERYPYSMRVAVDAYVNLLLRAIGGTLRPAPGRSRPRRTTIAI